MTNYFDFVLAVIIGGLAVAVFKFSYTGESADVFGIMSYAKSYCGLSAEAREIVDVEWLQAGANTIAISCQN